MKDELRGRFNPKNPNIDVRKGLMWEFNHHGKRFDFRVDDIAGIGKERLQRYDRIWSEMIVDSYNAGVSAGRNEVFNMTLADLLKTK